MAEANRFSVSPMTHPLRRRSVKCISWPGASQPKLPPPLPTYLPSERASERPSLLAARPLLSSPSRPLLSVSLIFSTLLSGIAEGRVHLSGAHATETPFSRKNRDNTFRQHFVRLAGTVETKREAFRSKRGNFARETPDAGIRGIFSCGIFSIPEMCARTRYCYFISRRRKRCCAREKAGESLFSLGFFIFFKQ